MLKFELIKQTKKPNDVDDKEKLFIQSDKHFLIF